MGRSVNWDEIPDSTLLPEDLYLMEVDTLTEESSKKGHLMYSAIFRVVEPATFTGIPIFDYFVIGTESDPTGTEPETWKNSVGLRRMKRFFKSAGVPFAADVDLMVEAAKSQRFVAQIGQEVDDGTRDPKYKGVRRNRIVAMYPLGERAVGSGVAAAPGEPVPSTPVSRRSATAAPTVRCPFCSEVIARADYTEHVKANHPDAAE